MSASPAKVSDELSEHEELYFVAVVAVIPYIVLHKLLELPTRQGFLNLRSSLVRPLEIE